jgi:hypothetical protein
VDTVLMNLDRIKFVPTVSTLLLIVIALEMKVPAAKIHPCVENHRSPFCICILNLDMGLEEAEVPGFAKELPPGG